MQKVPVKISCSRIKTFQRSSILIKLNYTKKFYLILDHPHW